MKLRYCEKCGDIIQLDRDVPMSPAEQFVCAKCSPTGEDSHTVSESKGPSVELENSLSTDNLNFFSKGSVALRKRQMEEESIAAAERFTRETKASAGSSTAQPSATAGPQLAADESGEMGSAAPASRAQRIVFSCPHCKSPFSIRPVSTTSRLGCPSCGKKFYVSTSGQLSTKPLSQRVPQSGSAVSRKAPRPGVVSQPAAKKPETPRAEEVQLKRELSSSELPSQKAEEAPLVKCNPKTEQPAERAERLEQLEHVQQVEVRKPKPRQAKKKPKSVTTAFEDHLRSEDPEKTYFVTEQETSDLADIRLGQESAFSLLSKGNSSRGAKRRGSRGSTDSHADEEAEVRSLLGEEKPSRSRLTKPDSRRRESPASARPRLVRRMLAVVGSSVLAAFLAVILSLPLLAINGLENGVIKLKSGNKGEQQPHAYFQKLGQQATVGLEKLSLAWERVKSGGQVGPREAER